MGHIDETDRAVFFGNVDAPLPNWRDIEESDDPDIADADDDHSGLLRRLYGYGNGNLDIIPGGKAAGRSASEFDPEQLAAGQRVEMEHTDDPAVAREIAQDHLAEDPNYYRKLRRVEG